jgi:hypothetical protein
VIVTPELVLYAGHCGPDVGFVESTGGVLIPSRCEAHKDSHPGYEMDIAFCLVEHAESRRLDVGPLPEGELVAFGFGSPTGPRVLRQFEVEFASFTTHGGFSSYTPAFGVCPGDSGGPLFDKQGRLVGLVSAALRGDDCNFVETVPRITYHVALTDKVLSWITKRSGIVLDREP